MKRLSVKAYELVDQLYKLDEESGWFGKPLYGSDIVAALIELSSLKEPVSITCVSQFLFSKDRAVRSAAHDALAEILHSLAPLELLQLPDAFGWEYDVYAYPEWNNLKPSQVDSLASVESDHTSAAILGLLSFHRSGYIRQEAVLQLSRITTGTELPFLLIRQNDWVDPVSRLAQSAVKDRLAADYSEHFTDCFELVAHLPQFGRNDLSDIADAIFSQILLPGNEELLKRAFKACEHKTGRQLIKRGFELPGEHQQRLAWLGMESEDVSLRLWSARWLLSASTDDTITERLLRDAFAPIRREAYQAMADQHPHTAVAAWTNAAFDRSEGTRDLARFQLRKHDQVDVRQLYLDALGADPDSLPVLAGLSECALAEDVFLLRRYSRHKYPNRRRTAISGLARILDKSIADELVDWLSDESPAVAKQAERSLKKIANAIDGNRLFAVLERTPTDSGKIAVLRLFYDMGKWKSLPWLIRSTGLRNAFVSEHAETLAYWWLVGNSVFTKPHEHEEQAIKDAYRDVSQVISASFIEKLEEFLPFDITCQ